MNAAILGDWWLPVVEVFYVNVCCTIKMMYALVTTIYPSKRTIHVGCVSRMESWQLNEKLTFFEEDTEATFHKHVQKCTCSDKKYCKSTV